MVVGDAILRTIESLRRDGIEEADKESLFIISNLIGVKPSRLFLERDKPFETSLESVLEGILTRRARREPLHYILGEREFYGFPFKVNPSVLIPRPETEHLVWEAVNTIKEDPMDAPLILDLCTGSGCVAVAIAKEIPHSRVFATDISKGAIEVAKSNAMLNGVSDRIEFLDGDLFSPLDGLALKGPFDLITSNPPYVKKGDFRNLAPEVFLHEPVIALDGGEEGLDFIRRIIFDSPRYMKNGGWLIVEIGYGQAGKARNIMEESGEFSDLEIKKDYSGIERVLKARKRP